MDEGLSYETLTVSVPSQGLAHLVLISLSGYLNIHSRSVLSERQEMWREYSVHIQTELQVKDK